MANTQHLKSLAERLKLPHTDLATLQFCGDNKPSAIQQWINRLPVTKPLNTSILLYQALPEVCRIQTTPEQRMDILELLRPYVQQCIDSLAAKFLDRPLTLPEDAMKTAAIAQALQKHVSNGYCQVVVKLIDEWHTATFDQTRQELLGLALHRAMSSMGQQYLRNSQLYSSAPSGLWFELNLLYQIAEGASRLKQRCPDLLLTSKYRTTVQQAYMRILLLAIASPNQMQQHEIKRLYDALEELSDLTRLHPTKKDEPSELFAIDVDNAHPPTYRRRWRNNPATLRVIKLSAIVSLLEDSTKAKDSNDNSKPALAAALTPRITAYLLQKWRQEQIRQEQRANSNNDVEMVVGLTLVHFHLANKCRFDQFLSDCGEAQVRKNTFLSADMNTDLDPWADAHDAEKLNRSAEDLQINYKNAQQTDTPQDQPERFGVYTASTVDNSPSGYCLEWEASDTPPQLKAGEIIALRTPGQLVWKIGVIRWMKRHSNASQIGIQLIAEHTSAIAARQRLKTGKNNVFMRSFISQSTLIKPNTPAIITAAVPFKLQDKVLAAHPEQSAHLQLNGVLLSTSSINVFTYQPTDDSGPTGDWETIYADGLWGHE